MTDVTFRQVDSQSFVVIGKPIAYAIIANNRGKSYKPKRLRDWQHKIRHVAKQSLKTIRPGSLVRLDLVFCFKLPKSRKKDRPIAAHTVRPDRDNLTKAAQDALSAHWSDDCTVVIGETAKIYTEGFEGVLVYVETGVDILEELDRMGALEHIQGLITDEL